MARLFCLNKPTDGTARCRKRGIVHCTALHSTAHILELSLRTLSSAWKLCTVEVCRKQHRIVIVQCTGVTIRQQGGCKAKRKPPINMVGADE